jgi:hypothetical protein
MLNDGTIQSRHLRIIPGKAIFIFFKQLDQLLPEVWLQIGADERRPWLITASNINLFSFISRHKSSPQLAVSAIDGVLH